MKDLCSKAKYGKGIQRSEYQEYINQNKQRIENNKDYYRKRQTIVEHPYGTIKRQWGFSYTLTKKYIKRAQADVGLMFAAYNLRRIMNSIDRKALTIYLRKLVLSVITVIAKIRVNIKTCNTPKYLTEYDDIFMKISINQLKFNRILINSGCF